MPKRSDDRSPSMEDRALLLMDAAHEGELGPSDLMVAVIQNLREGVEAGEDDATLAMRLGPGIDRVLDTREAAATLGRRGGKARAAKLSASRRAEIARRAAAARWAHRRNGSS